MLRRYAFAWLILVAVAMLNGALRQAVYGKSLTELSAHQVSTFTGLVLFGLVIAALSRLWPLASARQAWSVGFIWLAMTVAFEFLFGRFVVGQAWSALFHDYNILEGRVWLFVPIWVAVAPYFFHKLGSKRLEEFDGNKKL